MDTARLEKLKESIDAAIHSDTPEAMVALAEQLESALAEIKPKPQPASGSSDSTEARLILQSIKEAWYSSIDPPPHVIDTAQQQPILADLLNSMLATQRFALALARGDLSQTLNGRGAMAATLKSLQANLRHLTWQTEMIARGDFSQTVEFMGEFSTSFNAMVASLAAARQQIHEQNETLAQINASLMEEISGRRKANERAEIQRRLMEQREQERLQLARDLHDGPLQDVIALLFILNNLLRMDPEPSLREQMLTAKEVTNQLVDELRQFAGELRPPALSKFGLKEAIHSHLGGFLKKNPGLEIELVLQCEDKLLPETAWVALFRIYQESLNNIVKHAGASRVKVELQTDSSQVRLQIEDNGHGFVPPDDWLELARNSHLGLVGIRERAEAIGGRVEIWSQPQHGTKIAVFVPV